MRRHSQGFTLIEVLITVFVVAIGLLTAAGLQIISKKANFDALQRTSAAAMAQDILSRMRANPVQANANAYVTSDVTVSAATTPNPLCEGATQCTASQLAAYDLWQWANALKGVGETDSDGRASGGLASATGCVQAGADGRYTVVIAWRGLSPIRKPADADLASDPATNTCGKDKASYKAEADEGGDEATYRRILVLETFISS